MKSITRHAVSKARVPILVTLAFLVAACLTGCQDADPDEVEWRLVAEGDIVAMNSTTGVYVEGFISMLGGGIKSESRIDYKYARELDNGGLRQDLISATVERIAGDTDVYPGSDIVTIYQDAKPDGSNARIEIYKCSTSAMLECVMPSGGNMHRSRYRVDVHVPEGAVVQKFSDEDKGSVASGSAGKST